MVLPFICSPIHDSNSADGDFSDVVWEGCACANGAEEGVPSICDSWVVKQSEIEWLKRTRGAASGDAVVDCFILGGEVGLLWVYVWDSHFGGCCGVEVVFIWRRNGCVK